MQVEELNKIKNTQSKSVRKKTNDETTLREQIL